MGGSNEVNIVCTLGLELQHDFGKTLGADRLTASATGDIGILTKDAGERAAREEDRARAICSRDGRLLPHVKGGTGKIYFAGFSAIAELLMTIYAAISRAEMAILV